MKPVIRSRTSRAGTKSLPRLSRAVSAGDRSDVAEVWSGWASEIAADAVAFVHTGFASVAALHDVLAGEIPPVFRHTPGDPHPIGYLRVLLGVEMCRYFYGAGPWDDLALAWTPLHSTKRAPSETRGLLDDSLPVLQTSSPDARHADARVRGSRLRALVRPERVSPGSLNEMADRIGPRCSRPRIGSGRNLCAFWR